MEFQITLNHIDFSGPFDILLGLIERKRIPLSEISILNIIDDFIFFLDNNYDNLPKDSIAEFISLASSLIYIKSQYLLPRPLKPEEGEVLLKNLELRLQLLSDLRFALKDIDILAFSKLSHVYLKKDYTQIPFSLKDHHYDISFFHNLVVTILKRTTTRINDTKEKVLPVIVLERTVSLPEIIAFWEQSFIDSTNKKLLFYDQFNKLLNKFEITSDIVNAPQVMKKNLAAHFLSVLELSRNHGVVLHQNDDFGDIIIIKE